MFDLPKATLHERYRFHKPAPTDPTPAGCDRSSLFIFSDRDVSFGR
jgi:sugar lactone lactonase YvrE